MRPSDRRVKDQLRLGQFIVLVAFVLVLPLELTGLMLVLVLVLIGALNSLE